MPAGKFIALVGGVAALGEGLPYTAAYTQNTGTEPLTKPGLSHRAAGAVQQVCLTAKVPPRVHPSASKPL